MAQNKTSIVEVMRLTISEAIILAVITKVFWGSQEVFLYRRDGAIGVVIDPLPGCSALLKLLLLSPLQTDQELVDIKDDAARLRGASLPWTLNQAHACTSLLLPALNGTCTDTYYTCTHTSCTYKVQHAFTHTHTHTGHTQKYTPTMRKHTVDNKHIESQIVR